MIDAKIEKIPMTNGCYIFLNKNKDIIYIGKSKQLKKRVKQYFTKKNIYDKAFNLQREIKDVVYIETSTEQDALLLECYLIKKNQPKYNRLHKNNKTFPLVTIDLSEDYPKFKVCNEIDLKNSAFYYGFFYSQNHAEKVIELINETWKLPICSTNNTRCCLRYEMKKCISPYKTMSKKSFKKIILNIKEFLDGENDNILCILNNEFQTAMNELKFEKAEIIHKKITNLKNLKVKIRKTNYHIKNKKVLIFFRAFNENIFSIFYIENEIVKYREIFFQNDKIQLQNFMQKIKGNYFEKTNKIMEAKNILEIVSDKYLVKLDENFVPEIELNLVIEEFLNF